MFYEVIQKNKSGTFFIELLCNMSFQSCHVVLFALYDASSVIRWVVKTLGLVRDATCIAHLY